MGILLLSTLNFPHGPPCGEWLQHLMADIAPRSFVYQNGRQHSLSTIPLLGCKFKSTFGKHFIINFLSGTRKLHPCIRQDCAEKPFNVLIFGLGTVDNLKLSELPILLVYYYLRNTFFSDSFHIYLYIIDHLKIFQFSSVAQSCLTHCDPMNRSTPGLPVHHQLPEFTQSHVHRVSDAIPPLHPLSSPSPPAPTPSPHQGLFQWVNSSHEVTSLAIINFARGLVTHWIMQEIIILQNRQDISNTASNTNKKISRDLHHVLSEAKQVSKRPARPESGSLEQEIWFRVWISTCLI